MNNDRRRLTGAAAHRLTGPRANPQKQRDRGWWTVCFLALCLSACHSEPDSPEAQIRALIAKAEAAAEKKDLGTLKGMVSEAYKGPNGENRQELMRAVAYHLLQQQSIHLLTQVREIRFPEPSLAEATVFVGMAGRTIEGLDDLARLRADVYRVDFTAAEESARDWKVKSVEWRPAEMSDLQGDEG